MKNKYIYEINMWRWLLGIPLAAIAIIAVFFAQARDFIPFAIALLSFYLITVFVYIPCYYGVFSFMTYQNTVIINKGIIVKTQTILPLEGNIVFERVSVFPFSLFHAGSLLVRSRGVLISFPVMQNKKINEIVKDIKNDKG